MTKAPWIGRSHSDYCPIHRFVNGGELFVHLQREGRFTEERSRFYAAELLCALEHLHSYKVCEPFFTLRLECLRGILDSDFYMHICR